MRESVTESGPGGTRPSRRAVLTTGLGLAGGVALWAGGTGTANAATGADDNWAKDTTQNGWEVASGEDSKINELRIQGSNATVTVQSGAAATLLLYVARRFHYEIHSLSAGDVTGHTTSRKVASAFESNYLSGTAIAIRPTMYPAGVKGGFFPNELVVIRDILADCEGAVRWGGDERTVVKESHFQIDVPPGDAGLRNVAAKLNEWAVTPGKGAGAINAFNPARRKAAQRLQQRQAA